MTAHDAHEESLLGRQADFLLGLYPVAGRPEQRTARGKITQEASLAYIRFCGPLGGARPIYDAAVLRAEAERLWAVADLLDAAQAREAAAQDEQAGRLVPETPDGAPARFDGPPLDEVREFVTCALQRAKATGDTDVQQVAERSSAHPGARNYGLGLRDGVVMCCEQVLAKLDEIGENA